MQKPHLVLVPGFLCNEKLWEAQVPSLSTRFDLNISVAEPGVQSLREMAQAILESAPEKFSLAGHSMGAKVAMELMGMAADRVEQLVLMDTGVHTVSADEPEKRQSLIDLAESRGMAAVIDILLPQMIHSRRIGDLDLVDTIKQMMSTFSISDLKDQIAASLGREDHRLILPTVKCRTLILCGEQDIWSPVSQHREIEKQIENAQLEVIPDTGHMITMEAPEHVDRILMRWLQN